MNKGIRIWKDNVWKDAGIADEMIISTGFQFGFGLFETVRVHRGIPFDLDAHLDRMTASIAVLDQEIPYPFNRERFSGAIFEALRKCDEEECVLKIISYRGTTSWTYCLTNETFPLSSVRLRARILTVTIKVY